MLGFYGVKLNSTRLTLELDGRGLELGRFDGVGRFICLLAAGLIECRKLERGRRGGFGMGWGFWLGVLIETRSGNLTSGNWQSLR